MVAIDQNLLYIIIAVVVVVIILLAVLLRRRRGSPSGPANVNQYLQSEAELTKAQIIESREGFKAKKPMYMRKPEDDISDIRGITRKLQRKNIYYSPEVLEKLDELEHQENLINLKKQADQIHKKSFELQQLVKPKKDR